MQAASDPNWMKYLTNENENNANTDATWEINAPKYVDFSNLEQAETAIDQFFSTRLESPDTSVVSKSRKSLSGLKRKVDPGAADAVLQALEQDFSAPASKPALSSTTPATLSTAKATRSASASASTASERASHAASSQPIFPLRSTAALTIPREFNFNTSKRKRDAIAPPASVQPTRQAAAPRTAPRSAAPSRAPAAKVMKTVPNSSVRSQPPREAKAAALPKVSHLAATTVPRGSTRRSPLFARLSKPKVAPAPAANTRPAFTTAVTAAPTRSRLTVPRSPKFAATARPRSLSRSFLAPKPSIKKEEPKAYKAGTLSRRALNATAGEVGISLVPKNSLTVPKEVNMSTSTRASNRASMSVLNSSVASSAPNTVSKKKQSLGGVLPSAANSSILASALKAPGTVSRQLTVPRSPTLSTKKRAQDKLDTTEFSQLASAAKPTPSRSSVRATPASTLKSVQKSVLKLTEPKPFNFTVDKRSAAADKFKQEMAQEIEKEAEAFAAFRPSPYSAAKKRKSVSGTDAPKSVQKSAQKSAQKVPLAEVSQKNAVNIIQTAAAVVKPLLQAVVAPPAPASDELSGFQLHTDSRFLQLTQMKNKEFEQQFVVTDENAGAQPRPRHSPRLAAALRGL